MKVPRIPQYEAKGYVDGCWKKADELFSAAFGGRHFQKDAWEWQFHKNPCRNKCITTLWDGDTLVALNALTPAYALLKQEKTLVALSGTTMARDDHRGASLQLIRECAEQNRDIQMIYAFPNKNAINSALRWHGHTHVGDIAFWSCSPRSITIDPRIRKITEFSELHGMLYAQIAEEYTFIKMRTEEFLNWRFVQNPVIDYEIYEYTDGTSPLGYAVLDEYIENGQKQLQVIDYVAISKDVLYALFSYAINASFEKGCSLIKTWMTVPKYEEIMRDLGFVYGEHPFPMTLWKGMLNITESYITMADSDIF